MSQVVISASALVLEFFVILAPTGSTATAAITSPARTAASSHGIYARRDHI
jgi:hypothetical protein